MFTPAHSRGMVLGCHRDAVVGADGAGGLESCRNRVSCSLTRTIIYRIAIKHEQLEMLCTILIQHWIVWPQFILGNGFKELSLKEIAAEEPSPLASTGSVNHDLARIYPLTATCTLPLQESITTYYNCLWNQNAFSCWRIGLAIRRSFANRAKHARSHDKWANRWSWRAAELFGRLARNRVNLAVILITWDLHERDMTKKSIQCSRVLFGILNFEPWLHIHFFGPKWEDFLGPAAKSQRHAWDSWGQQGNRLFLWINDGTLWKIISTCMQGEEQLVAGSDLSVSISCCRFDVQLLSYLFHPFGVSRSQAFFFRHLFASIQSAHATQKNSTEVWCHSDSHPAQQPRWAWLPQHHWQNWQAAAR